MRTIALLLMSLLPVFAEQITLGVSEGKADTATLNMYLSRGWTVAHAIPLLDTKAGGFSGVSGTVTRRILFILESPRPVPTPAQTEIVDGVFVDMSKLKPYRDEQYRIYRESLERPHDSRQVERGGTP